MHSAVRNRKFNPIGLRPIDDELFGLPQVLAVQFDQVEGVEDYAFVSAVVTDKVERGNAVVIAGDRFAIDQAGTHLEPVNGLDDERIARWPIVPVDADRVAPSHQSIPVVLDFVDPAGTARRKMAGRVR